jgi:hypothetical protein
MPQEVFDAINNERRWWSGEIAGDTNKLGAEFTYTYGNMHKSTQRATEFVPGKKIVWRVTDADLIFIKDKTELRFTHVGLVPEFECYGGCSGAWSALVDGNLRKLIETGKKPVRCACIAVSRGRRCSALALSMGSKAVSVCGAVVASHRVVSRIQRKTRTSLTEKRNDDKYANKQG